MSMQHWTMIEVPSLVSRRVVSAALVFLGVGAVACLDRGSPADDFGAADPVALDVSVEVVANGQAELGFAGYPDLTPDLIADDSGVYWFDENGSVFGRQRGEAEAVELLAGVESLHESLGEGRVRVVIGLATGNDSLFAGDGYVIDDYEFIVDAPPSRLLSISKQGRPASVLVESETELLYPLVVNGERLIVVGVGTEPDARLYQVSLAEPALVPLPARFAPDWVTASDGHVYWTVNGTLWRAGFEGQPERIAQLRGDDVSVCPGYLLARHRAFPSDFSIAGVDSMFFYEAKSERPRGFARLGRNILGTVCDAQHVYYYSSQPLEGREPEGELVRIDVESGQLARLSSPELMQGYVQVVGDDAENIYVSKGGAILAVRKP